MFALNIFTTKVIGTDFSVKEKITKTKRGTFIKKALMKHKKMKNKIKKTIGKYKVSKYIQNVCVDSWPYFTSSRFYFVDCT